MSTLHVCIVTEELAPVTSGGIGQVVASVARRLVEQGCEVSVVFAPRVPVDSVTEVLPGARLVHLALGAGRLSRWFGGERWRQLRIARAVAAIGRSHPIDVIEVPDYHGLGAGLLRVRASGVVRYSGAVVAVRIHGTSEVIRGAEHRRADDAALSLEGRERTALRLADVWIAPSAAIAKEYQRLYPRGDVAVVHNPLPLELAVSTPHARMVPRADAGRVLFYGRLQTIKGVESFIDAAVAIAARRPRCRFSVVGADVPFVGGPSMQAALTLRIPGPLRHAFDFLGRLEHSALRELVLRHDVAVVPSIFETFCLAAHELNAIGIPLVLRRIPAFTDYFEDGKNARFFASDAELPAVIESVLDGAAVGWRWNAPTIAQQADEIRSVYDRVARNRR